MRKKYFAWSPPRHLSICYWQIFWHSIWHIISSGIRSGISSGTQSGISSGILSGKSSGILSGISSGILSGILFGKSSGILSDILSGILSGISSGILSGRWGPAVPTELGRSQVEVHRCPLSSEGPRLRSSGAHWARKPAVEVQRCPLRSEPGGWGPAVPTALRTWRLRSSRAHSDRKPAVEVQQCPLRAEVGEELGDELARRKWMWKLMQTWSRRNWRRKRRRRRRRRMRRTALIKSNNPHLAGGEWHKNKFWALPTTKMKRRLPLTIISPQSSGQWTSEREPPTVEGFMFWANLKHQQPRL